jgi:VanZ family protein
MSLLSVSRERFYWAAALSLVGLTWSTLYWARLVAEQLRDRGWLNATMWAIFAVAGLGVLVLVGRQRPGWREVAVLAAFAAAYGVAITTFLKLPEEALHFVQYGLVGGLFFAALAERRRHPAASALLHRPAVPALFAFLLTLAAGWTDEGIQYLLPNRVYDLRDVAFNAAAGALAIAGTAAWRWARQRGGKEAPGPLV